MSSMDEIYMDYVDSRKHEADDGTWWICDGWDGEILSGPYTEEKIDEILWSDAIEFAHEQFIP